MKKNIRRLLALITLTSYFTISPAVLAADESEDLKMCEFKDEDYTSILNNETEYNEFLKNESNKSISFEEALGGSYDKGNCGEENKVTGFLEKGDCTEAGKVITEISEVIGGKTSTENEENEIINVYKGTCCLVSVDEECKKTREIYTKSYEDCDDAAIGCNKRQWIIGTSGMGIIKVYLKQIYRWAAVTVGFISVVTIVISGIQISISGVSGDISSAKNRILQAAAGLVLLFLSSVILYTINPSFFS